MKKLNTTNKIYTGILLLIILATAVKLWRYKGWERYYYSSSFSSPASYPIYIRNGYFILEDGEIESISNSDVNDHRNMAWGDGTGNDPNRKERLPVKIVFEYASYRDELFYKDTINLPLDTIRAIFKNAKKTGVSTSIYHAPEVKRLDFVIGVANKGNVIVWLRGEKFENVLLKHKMIAKEPRGDQTYHGARLSKKAFLKEVFYIDSADLEAYRKGIDKEANYIDTPSSFIRRLNNEYPY